MSGIDPRPSFLSQLVLLINLALIMLCVYRRPQVICQSGQGTVLQSLDSITAYCSPVSGTIPTPAADLPQLLLAQLLLRLAILFHCPSLLSHYFTAPCPQPT